MFFSKSDDSKNPYLQDSDVRLMLEFQKGNKASFEILLKKYFPRVLNFIYRYIGNKEQAEDLAQEVFIRVYTHVSTYKPRAQFKTWLYTIAKRVSFNESRRQKRHIYSLDHSYAKDDNGSVPIADEKATKPDEALIESELKEVVKEAIGALPKKQRMAIILRKYDNYSYREIARIMHISEKAVKSLLNRGKENLRGILKKRRKDIL